MTLLEIIYLEPCHNRNADSVKVVNSDQDKEPFEFTIRETYCQFQVFHESPIPYFPGNIFLSLSFLNSLGLWIVEGSIAM